MDSSPVTVEALLPTSSAKKQRILSRYQPSIQYHDILFAVLFFGHFCVLIGVSFGSGFNAFFFEPAKHITINSDKTQTVDSSGRFSSSSFIGGFFFVLFLAGFMSLLWVHVLTNLSHVIIPFTFGLIFCVSSATMSIYMAYDNLAGAFSLLLFVLILTYMYVYLRPRMDFAATTLKVACAAIRAHPATLLYAGVMVLAQIWFCLLWTTAVLGVATNEWNRTIYAGGKPYDVSSCTTYNYYQSITIGESTLDCPQQSSSCVVCVCGGSSIAGFQQCFKSKFNGNVIHCTVSGVVSHWWCTPALDDDDSVARESALSGEYKEPVFSMARIKALFADNASKLVVSQYFVQSVTASFGSICLGSMLVAVVRTSRVVLRFLVDKMKPKGRGQGCLSLPNFKATSTVYPAVLVAGKCTSTLQLLVLRCLEYLLAIIESCLEYFNRYAFCYVGIYNMSFVEASKAVVAMFRERGVTAIVNDEIIDIILTLAHLVIAIFCSAVAYIYAYGVHLNFVDRTVLVGTAFMGGYMICAVTMKVISSAVATVYVLYAESPDELQVAVPEAFEELSTAWARMYPSSSGSVPSKDIHRDLLGGAYSPPANSSTQSNEIITIAGKYNALPTDEEDGEGSSELVAEEHDRLGDRASPYGKSDGDSRSASSRIAGIWNNMHAQGAAWYAQAALIARAAAGENIRATATNESNSSEGTPIVVLVGAHSNSQPAPGSVDIQFRDHWSDQSSGHELYHQDTSNTAIHVDADNISV